MGGKKLMDTDKKFIWLPIISFFITVVAFAQDPVLPATNLGLTNITDAVSPPPGLYYNNYAQVYDTRSDRDASGMRIEGAAKINYFLSLHQLVYLSKIRALEGNVYFNALLPLVKLSAEAGVDEAPPVNPQIIGDLTIGTGIQWSGKKLFGHHFWHRAEIDMNLPSGNYKSEFAVNPSAHLYALSIYYTFTYFFFDHLSFGARDQFNYNFTGLDSKTKSGNYYNGNYSLEYHLSGSVNVALVGYFLKQLSEDSKNGNGHYFQDKYGLSTTREQVFGIGPGLSTVAVGGIYIEAKTFFETAALNRSSGIRSTLRLAVPLKFK